jgi:hypothetical protein
MGLETGTYINDLTITNPIAGDPKSQGDDHLRLIKKVLKNTVNGFTGPAIITGTDAGVVDVYVLTPSPALAAYVAGMLVLFSPGTTNTTASTLNISGLGAKAIKTVSGAALIADDIVAGSYYLLIYDGTNFRIINGPTKNYVDQASLTASLPSQTGNGGKFMKTDGSSASWERVEGLIFNGSGVGVAANTTLSVSNVGKWHEIQSGGLTVTLPPVANVVTGDTYTFKAQHPFTLAADGAELIHSTATAATTLSIADDEYLTLASNGTAWYVVSRGYNYAAAGSSKLWLLCGTAGNILDSFNITSITDVGTGQLTVTIANDFASVNYAVNATTLNSGATIATALNQAAGSFSIRSLSGGGVFTDPVGYGISAYGDQ